MDEPQSELPVAVAYSRMDISSKIRSTKCVRPQSSRLRHKIDNTYSYFTRKVDPIIAACVASFLFRQPVDILDAMRLYFHNIKNKIDADCFNEIECCIPKKVQQQYFAYNLGPNLSVLVDAIASHQPSDVIDFICRQLKNQKPVILGDDNQSDGRYGKESKHIPPTNYTIQKSKIPIAIPFTENIDENSMVIGTSSNIQNPKKDLMVGNIRTNSSQNIPEKLINSSEKIMIDNNNLKCIQISFLGMGGCGKTSIINALQGKFNKKMKPSLGFQPSSMLFGENASEKTNVKFYDLGGGKKIRDIWNEYYHDVHAVIYVFDCSLNGDDLNESIELFHKTIGNILIKDKPLMILLNKIDKKNNSNNINILSKDELIKLLNLQNYGFSDDIITECSSFISPSNENCFEIINNSDSENDETVDPRVESAIGLFLELIQKVFPTLDDRVKKDIEIKKNEELKKRFERERKVLKNKIASAFRNVIEPSLLPENLPPQGEDDSFTREEGLVFIAGEIGCEVTNLEQVNIQNV